MSLTPRCDALREDGKYNQPAGIARRWINLAEDLEKEVGEFKFALASAESKLKRSEVEAPFTVTQTSLVNRVPGSVACGACRYYRIETPNAGRCHRHPPTKGDGDGYFVHPFMAPDDWCGEWKAKP